MPTAAGLLGGALLVALATGLPSTAPTPSPAAATSTAGRPTALTASGRTLGTRGAPVVLGVWSDFQCPACRLFALDIEPRLAADHVASGRLQVVYRDFAFIGPESTAAAVAARCASAQEAFWPYHDRLFAAQGAENSGVYGTSALIAISRSLGLDGVRFEACLADPVLHRQVAAETEAGRSRGVVSTPTLDFGGRAIAGVPRYEALDALVRQLADAGDPP